MTSVHIQYNFITSIQDSQLGGATINQYFIAAFLFIFLSPLLSSRASSINNTSIQKYERRDWVHWVDFDNDCQNTRHEVLIRDHLGNHHKSYESVLLQYHSSKRCYVATGKWLDPYSGKFVFFAKNTSIDHLVPLKNAHISSGSAWTLRKKMAFANDEENLVITTPSSNSKKGDRSPDKWRPNNKKYWCKYAFNWKYIKDKYKLTFTKKEKAALIAMLRTCS